MCTHVFHTVYHTCICHTLSPVLPTLIERFKCFNKYEDSCRISYKHHALWRNSKKTDGHCMKNQMYKRWHVKYTIKQDSRWCKYRKKYTLGNIASKLFAWSPKVDDPSRGLIPHILSHFPCFHLRDHYTTRTGKWRRHSWPQILSWSHRIRLTARGQPILALSQSYQ